jgi:hypothetical protein
MLASNRNRALVPAMALGGVLSAILGVYGHEVYDQSWLGFAIPGVVFALTISLGFILCSYRLKAAQLALAIVVTSSAFALSVLAAIGTEILIAPGGELVMPPWHAMFVSGTVGAFLFLVTFLFATDTKPFKKILLVALKFSAVGGVLGVIGLTLSSTLGESLWRHFEAFKTHQPLANFQGIHLSQDGGGTWLFSILPVWEVGMGVTLALLLHFNQPRSAPPSDPPSSPNQN